MIYRALAKLYHWTPSQIAEMTPYTQLVMLDIEGAVDNEGSEVLHFETEEEYAEWFQQQRQ